MSEHPPHERVADWKPDAEFLRVAKEVLTLRERENSSTVGARTKLILSLFSKEEGASFIERCVERSVPFVIYPDANGLRLDLGRDGVQGIHSHVPYEFLTDEVLASVAEFIDEGELGDLRVRIAEARGDEKTTADLSAREEEAFLRSGGGASLAELYEGNLEGALKAYGEGRRLPSASIRAYLAESKQAPGHIRDMMRAAAYLNSSETEAVDALVQQEREHAIQLDRMRDMPRFTKALFDARSTTLHERPENAEVSKILTVLFSEYSYPELQAMGIEAVRGSFSDGQEFLALYSAGSYQRVLIDPKKHVRGKEAYARFSRIPSVERSDFEAFEGLMLPYAHLQALREIAATETPDDPSASASHIRAVLGLLAAELSPDDHEPLLMAGREYASALQKGEASEESRNVLQTRVDNLLALYGATFARPAKEIIETHLMLPKRVEAVFDGKFIDGAPEALQERMRAYYADFPVQAPKTTIVRSGTEHAVPFALEGRALRALKIEPRPTLILAIGALHETMERQEDVDAIADSIIEAAKDVRANVFMQGSQSGKIAETLARKYWAYRASLGEGEEPALRILAIEPGRSLYAGENGYSNDELKDAFPILPFDTLLTPYDAGWTEGVSLHSYYPHLVLRQNIIRRASHGHPAAMLSINGGRWSVPECVEAISDGFPIISLPDSGRLASFIAHAHRTRSAWKDKGPEEGLRVLERFIDEQEESKRAGLRLDLENMKGTGLLELLGRIAEGMLVEEADAKTLEAKIRSLLKSA